jgi:hypothetical protein
MNQPIKTALPSNIKKLLRKAESTLHHSLKENIEASYKGADGSLDPVAMAIVGHINCLQSVFAAVEDLLETPPLKYLVGDVLHGALMLNLSFSKLCGAANEARGTPLNGYDVDEPLYKYEDSLAILNAINAAQVLDDVIADLRETI